MNVSIASALQRDGYDATGELNRPFALKRLDQELESHLRVPSSPKYTSKLCCLRPRLVAFKSTYDFIVFIGMGTTANIIAGCLASNPKVSILIVEAGNPQDIADTTTPAKAFDLRGSQYNWAYRTTVVDHPDYTDVEKPNTCGKVLGGFPCLNYYPWVPRSAATFDDWKSFGGETCGWNGVEKYLKKTGK
ncbi:hypothetical protein BKA65DRAFT_600353 [Rhexocercosporidium sp. MPI-PUGE-AT-0058]|nr:hypothetical protein BKA65DRAFT_600353 [Rhexocercosporidium sp. MPI-PUGE-AT-0058]